MSPHDDCGDPGCCPDNPTLVQRLREAPSFCCQTCDYAVEAADRIEALEAALREISARVIRFTYQGPSLLELNAIARRALEGKS